MDKTAPLYSLKKPGHWLWRTGFTREQVLARLQDSRITDDWLICPLGEANKATAVAHFVADRDVFLANARTAGQGTRESEPLRKTQQALPVADAKRHGTREDTPAWLVAGAGPALMAVVALLGWRTIYLPASKSGWTLGWVYLGLFTASIFANLACLSIWNPVVLARRMVWHAGQKIWDIVLMMVFLAVFVVVIVVAVQDLGARRVDPPLGVGWLIGLTMFGLGWVIVTWAMVANPFFEKHVRIQTDHGQHVVDRGPYAYVRHPGYVGFSAVLLGTPLMLVSAATLPPILVTVGLLVIRTALEDHTLQAELPGYREYAARVRYRLMPGVW